MALNDYLNLKKDIKKKIDTLEFNFRTAYNKAEETTRDNEGDINLDSLQNEGNRDKFIITFNNNILNSSKKYFKIHHRTKLDDFKEHQLMDAYMGFSGVEVNQLINSAKENISYKGMAESLEENISNIIQKMSMVPSTKLKHSDANDVIKYTNTAGIINPEELKIPNMIELIAEYEKNGIVTPKFINQKPYRL